MRLTEAKTTNCGMSKHRLVLVMILQIMTITLAMTEDMLKLFESDDDDDAEFEGFSDDC